MSVMLKTGHGPETADLLLEKVKSFSGSMTWKKVVASPHEGSLPAKGTIYEAHDFVTTAYGFYWLWRHVAC